VLPVAWQDPLLHLSEAHPLLFEFVKVIFQLRMPRCQAQMDRFELHRGHGQQSIIQCWSDNKAGQYSTTHIIQQYLTAHFIKVLCQLFVFLAQQLQEQDRLRQILYCTKVSVSDASN
jgi:hypothetical protein